MKFQGYLREKMLEKTITQQALADKVGRTRSTIGDKLNRSNDIKMSIAIELLHALNCSLIVVDNETGERTEID